MKEESIMKEGTTNGFENIKGIRFRLSDKQGNKIWLYP